MTIVRLFMLIFDGKNESFTASLEAELLAMEKADILIRQKNPDSIYLTTISEKQVYCN